MASNYTENYGLCQWEATDQVLRTEFNEDNTKIDAVLQNLHEKNSGLEDLVQKCGNCQIYMTTYTGNGGSGQNSPNTLTFPNAPVLVLISGGQANSWGFIAQKTAILIPSGHFTAFEVSNSRTCPTTWSADKKTVSWFAINSTADNQFNLADVTYTVVALLDKA